MGDQGLHLRDFRPVSRLEPRGKERLTPRFPVIDAHNHLYHEPDIDDLLRRMDAFGIQMIIDLDGIPGGGLERQIQRLVRAHPGRFAVYTQLDIRGIDSPAFEQDMRDTLHRAREQGAAGIKFHKQLGLHWRDASGAFILPDDPRLQCIWRTAAQLQLPVTIHIADPVSFFDGTVDGTHERYEELHAHPNWYWGDKGTPGHAVLLAAQENLLRRNRDTTFVIAHIGSHAEDLRNVARMLEAHPNMYVDTAERIAELGRQPYTAREFLLTYQDRVIYGTDLSPRPANVSGNYRFFETRDEYFPYNDWDEHNQGRWNIYGVFLPEEALRKIYRENILRINPVLRERVGS